MYVSVIFYFIPTIWLQYYQSDIIIGLIVYSFHRLFILSLINSFAQSFMYWGASRG